MCKRSPSLKIIGYTSYFSLFMLHLLHSQFQLTISSIHKKTSWSTLTLWYYMAGELPHVPPLSTSAMLMLWKNNEHLSLKYRFLSSIWIHAVSSFIMTDKLDKFLFSKLFNICQNRKSSWYKENTEINPQINLGFTCMF